MRRLIKPIILLAIGAWAGSYVGMRYEAAAIQQSCESPEGATWINGTPYLCFSQQQIELMMQRQKAGRGT